MSHNSQNESISENPWYHPSNSFLSSPHKYCLCTSLISLLFHHWSRCISSEECVPGKDALTLSDIDILKRPYSSTLVTMRKHFSAFVLRKIQIASVGAAPVRNVKTTDIIYGKKKLPAGCFGFIVTNIRCQKKKEKYIPNVKVCL